MTSQRAPTEAINYTAPRHTAITQRQTLLAAGRLVLLKYFKSPQLSLHMLKRRKANADGDWTLDPVHTKSFVQTLDDAFSPRDVDH